VTVALAVAWAKVVLTAPAAEKEVNVESAVVAKLKGDVKYRDVR
jgi:hypothetical protein